MKLEWLGHSAFRLTESTGTTVVLDPFSCDSVGYGMAYLPADVVTISNKNPEHGYVRGIKGYPEVLHTEGNFEIKGVHFKSFLTDENAITKNLVFKLRIDGVEVCHLGDIYEECNPQLIDQLGSVNILLIPVGGAPSLDAEAAKEYIDRVMPDIVIPMQYKIKNCDLDLDKVDEFLKLFDDEDIVEMDEETLTFERDDFDNYTTTKVYVPKRFRG